MLNHPHTNALSVTTDVMIFVHGLGANGQDLLSLASFFMPHYPTMSFVAPNAPHSFHHMHNAYQWFPITTMDMSEIEQGCIASMHSLEHIIEEACAYYNIDDSHIILCGFSQGCMLALYHTLRRATPIKALLGFSGLLVGTLPITQAKNVPIFLAHGRNDTVVPYQGTKQAYDILHEHGFNVNAYIENDLEHSIGMESLTHAHKFLNTIL